MKDIKELALKVAKEMDAEYPRQDWTKALWDADFATRLIAAYTEGQEPVAWDGSEGWEQLAWNLCAEEGGEESCTELLWDGGPIPEPWGDRWLKYEGEAKRMISLVRKFTAPPEPAPQTDGSTTVSAPDQERMSRSVCAAPSSEEVREMVENLREIPLHEDIIAAADLIERLAARVPAITHDEWYAAQNRISELLIFVKNISEQIPEKPDYWNSCSQCEHNASEAEDLLIAAGEVKP